MHSYIDLSTGHLTAHTRNLLARFTSTERFDIGWPALTVSSYEYGWFVTVPAFDLPDLAEQCQALPKDLFDVLSYAHRHGAQLVRFDADGWVYGLPTYED